MEPEFEIAVIGGGAAGMAAAVTAAEQGKRTVLLERGGMLGRKLAATGNGRCNLMNAGPGRYYGDGRFALTVLEQCGAEAQTRFWHNHGLLLREESQGRVYPMTLQASTVVETLKAALAAAGVEVRLRQEILRAQPERNGFRIITGENQTLSAARLILATGGSAQPRLGGTTAGYGLMEALGHRVIPVRPALCGIITDRKSISGLSGLRVQGSVTVMRGESPLHSEQGEILFTETGISGICVMQCSRFVEMDGADTAELDLVPETLREPGRLRAEMIFRRSRFRQAAAEKLFAGMLPDKLSFAVCKQSGMPLRGETLGSLGDDDLDRAERCMRHYRLGIQGTAGIENAQVTAGGADCAEFDPRTMESRRLKGLFAAGEALNVDGDCGGFNLMFAFGSGILAGKNACK